MSDPDRPASLAAVVRDYEALWAERDPARRAALIAACLSAGATIVGPGYTLRGHRAIAAEAVRFQRSEPGRRACITGGIDAHGKLARFAVKIEDADGAAHAEGLDVVEFADDGRIARVITFWGTLPADGVRYAPAPAAREPAAVGTKRASEDGASPEVVIESCDTVPADAAAVDEGIAQTNANFTPLGDVRGLACFARAADAVVGGAVGRTWGECCELQQLWVHETLRGRGIGTRLMRQFEARAQARGCRTFYLDTFSFHAPGFYRGLGYETALAIEGYAPGVVRHTMMRRV